ncbi:MAG: RNase adapter RapZ, partial [Rhodospirillales bacterium]|nr:RNase adapter RapZ [Rhodospirillales bacterium]
MGTEGKSRLTTVLVTGMSGAGKTSALKAFEDLNFEAIDNVPLSLLETLAAGRRQFETGGVSRPLAVGVDIRTRDFNVDTVLAHHAALMDEGNGRASILFLDCNVEELQQRYEVTRHRHPLAQDRPVADGIAHEQRLLTSLRDGADLVIDTTGMAPGRLKGILQGQFADGAAGSLTIFLTSFSYRRGIPRAADLVFDVRFLANPHYETNLRELTGLDDRVGSFIEADGAFSDFFHHLNALLDPLLPR